ncbi:zinc-binding dehydrogenase [Actinomadura sp. KC06]|uniref:zinc-binding dehydrogenase n=1 Tax=Actinomadura sp. KC06 TaxID=2530369 RepID=UPI001AA00C9D|nr:zinc-binding dehydrogenase [Actinomadura sp. KC06]
MRVAAACLNNTDVWTRQGAYSAGDEPTGWSGEPISFPRIQGADVAGHIHEAGFGVPDSRRGERVLIDPMVYTGGERELVRPRYLGSEIDGGYAEFVAVPASNAHRIERRCGDAELATFPTAYLTALRMLERARVTRGETTLITGASGGVGSALVQLCRVRGARTVAVTSPGKVEQVARLGADTVLTRDELRAAGPVDVVADVVGGPLLRELLDEIIRPLGRYVTAGAIAGPLVELDLRRLYLKQIELIGSSFGSHEDFSRLVELIENGSLRPLLAHTYPLAEFVRAQQHFMRKDFVGNIALEMG